MKDYTAPKVEDLGDLTEMTQAMTFSGPEDGGNKNLPHHFPSDGLLP